MKKIQEAENLDSKIVLLRVDLNVESTEGAYRLERSLATIRYLLDRQAKVVLLSHRGRPAGKVDPKLSLDFLIPFLAGKLGVEALLLPVTDLVASRELIAGKGKLFVLENIRFVPGEEANEPEFAKSLASLGDVYVNDCFAVDHHGSVSVSGLSALMPHYAGFLVQEEVANLEKALKSEQLPLVVVIGGGPKAGEKFEVIKHLYPKATTFLIGGVMANTFMKARGVDMGASQTDDTILTDVQTYLNDPKIMLPTDFVFSDDRRALDLGPRSASAYAAVIATAKTVVWNGPMGLFEDERYRAGSVAIAQAIIDSKAFAVVGGGETTQFLLQAKLSDKFSFLSTGGGAMLAFLAGKKLPGLEALEG